MTKYLIRGFICNFRCVLGLFFLLSQTFGNFKIVFIQVQTLRSNSLAHTMDKNLGNIRLKKLDGPINR